MFLNTMDLKLSRDHATNKIPCLKNSIRLVHAYQWPDQVEGKRSPCRRLNIHSHTCWKCHENTFHKNHSSRTCYVWTIWWNAIELKTAVWRSTCNSQFVKFSHFASCSRDTMRDKLGCTYPELDSKTPPWDPKRFMLIFRRLYRGQIWSFVLLLFLQKKEILFWNKAEKEREILSEATKHNVPKFIRQNCTWVNSSLDFWNNHIWTAKTRKQTQTPELSLLGPMLIWEKKQTLMRT